MSKCMDIDTSKYTIEKDDKLLALEQPFNILYE